MSDQEPEQLSLFPLEALRPIEKPSDLPPAGTIQTLYHNGGRCGCDQCMENLERHFRLHPMRQRALADTPPAQ